MVIENLSRELDISQNSLTGLKLDLEQSKKNDKKRLAEDVRKLKEELSTRRYINLSGT